MCSFYKVQSVDIYYMCFSIEENKNVVNTQAM
jgi:hypothetical protein